MKDNGENKWLKNLPSHTPPDETWAGIVNRMDINLANEQLKTQLTGLPVHEPPVNLWARIEQKIASRRMLRVGFIASGIAATLLLAFILKSVFLSEPTNTQPASLLVRNSTEKHSPKLNSGTISRERTFAIKNKARRKIATFNNIPLAISDSTEKALLTTVPQSKENISEILLVKKYAEFQDNSPNLQVLKIKPSALITGNNLSLSSITKASAPVKNNPVTDTLTTWLLARNSKDNFPPPPKPDISNHSKGISIGFNFLPEPMSKSEKGSLAYQTFALMAQYQLPSVDFRTGLGISYQSAPMAYSADYISFDSSPGYVSDTIINNGDTLVGAVMGAGTVNMSGKERSSFLNYSIGAGKRIYSNKRFSTSLRIGAGISLLLNNQNKLSGPAYDALKNQSNTLFSNTQSNIPDIKQTQFDLATGFDFNYRLHKRWSLSVEPTLKYYFNPVYEGGNSRSFSTGLRTGILFKL